MDKFKNYKFGNIIKGVTKTVGSGVAHVGSGVLQGTKVAGTGVAAGTKIVGDTMVKSGKILVLEWFKARTPSVLEMLWVLRLLWVLVL